MKYLQLFSALAIFLLFGFQISFSQNSNVGIGTLTPDASALLDINSNNKGVLVPRMTAVQRLAISSPANALLVFDTDSNCFFFYKKSNVTWNSICGTSAIGSTSSSHGFRATIDSFSIIGVDIKFNNIIFNDGGNYNSVTGKYMCSSNGVYSFSGQIYLAEKVFNTAVDIYVNGILVQNIIYEPGLIPYQTGYSATMKLNTGDSVSLRISSGSGTISNSIFSGYKVY